MKGFRRIFDSDYYHKVQITIEAISIGYLSAAFTGAESPSAGLTISSDIEKIKTVFVYKTYGSFDEG